MTMNLSIETVPPTYSGNLTEAVDEYDPNALSNFSIRWTDNLNEIEHVYIENNFNGSIYNDTMAGVEIDDNDYIFNYSLVLPAGNFSYRYYGEDKAGNWNASDTYYVSVNKGDIDYTVNFNNKKPSNPVTYTYGTVSNVTVFKSVLEGVLSLFFNTSGIWQLTGSGSAISHVTTLPAGFSNYKFIFGGVSNYSYNESFLTFNIAKNSAALSVNYTPGNAVYGTPITMQCNMTAGDLSSTLTLFNDDDIVSFGQGNLSATGIFSAGTHNESCSYSETQNFSSYLSYDNIFTISKAVPLLGLNIAGQQGNITIPKCYSLNVTAWTDTSEGEIGIYKQNSTHVINPVNGSKNVTFIVSNCESSGESLKFIASYAESQNYSIVNASFFAFIDSARPVFDNSHSDVQYSASEDNFSVNFTVTWSDNINVSHVFLENNFNGTMLNETMYGSGFHHYNTSVRTGTYNYRFLANDTSDLWNSTGVSSFSVSFSPSPSPATGCVTACGGGGGGGNTPTVTVTTTVTTTTSAPVKISTTTSTSAKPAALVIQALRLGSLGGETATDDFTNTGGDSITGMFTGTFLDGANAVIAAVSAGLFAFAAWAYLSNSGHPKRRR